jgi:glutaredoxin
MTPALRTFILIVLGLALVQNWDRIAGAFSPPAPIPHVGPADVVLYSTAWCGYCEKTRKLLRERSVPFVEHDIERSPEGRRQYDALNGRGVPLLVVKGTVVRGYSPQAILSALGQ